MNIHKKQLNKHKDKLNFTPLHLMQSTHRPQRPELWTQKRELHGIEQIALSGSISSHHRIGPLIEGLDFGLRSKGSKVWYYDLFDVHGIVF